MRLSLPSPQLRGKISLEEAIKNRRSRRSFTRGSLTFKEVSQLLWAASGITDNKNNFRSAPSAGALYPLDIFVVAGEIEGLKKGIYQYLPLTHSLLLIKEGDVKEALCRAALSQHIVKEAQMNLVITAEYERVCIKYGERGVRYSHIEVGHIGQNILLQAEALMLNCVPIGAFYDEEVKTILSLPDSFRPLYIIPIGKR